MLVFFSFIFYEPFPKEELTQCSFIDDAKAKAKCEAALDDGSQNGVIAKGEAEVEEELTQCSFIDDPEAKAKCEETLDD